MKTKISRRARARPTRGREPGAGAASATIRPRARRGRRARPPAAGTPGGRSSDEPRRHSVCRDSVACLNERLRICMGRPARRGPYHGSATATPPSAAASPGGRGVPGGLPRGARSQADQASGEQIGGERRLDEHAQAERQAERERPPARPEALRRARGGRAPPPPWRPAADRAGSRSSMNTTNGAVAKRTAASSPAVGVEQSASEAAHREDPRPGKPRSPPGR